MLSVSRPCVLDLDDFCEGNSALIKLDDLRYEIPLLRVTLFMIPGMCTLGWLYHVTQSRPWLQLVPHGWMHTTPRECQLWTEQDARNYLKQLQPYLDSGMVQRGFKAPGWQISDALFHVLHNEGFWIADQDYNRSRRPHKLRYYELNPNRTDITQIHGHIGHMGGHNPNELSLIMSEIETHADATFAFASEHLELAP
jgi:hypothetical protein